MENARLGSANCPTMWAMVSRDVVEGTTWATNDTYYPEVPQQTTSQTLSMASCSSSFPHSLRRYRRSSHDPRLPLCTTLAHWNAASVKCRMRKAISKQTQRWWDERRARGRKGWGFTPGKLECRTTLCTRRSTALTSLGRLNAVRKITRHEQREQKG